MDWVGNRSYGVSLPYHYLSARQWDVLFGELGWRPEVKRSQLHLYPQPFSAIFDANLHFVARLTPRQTAE
jgi:hypothetical protein